MACRSCGSENLVTLRSELTASLTTLEGAKQAPVYVCQTLLACTTCGFAELQIPLAKLQELRRSTAGS
jgi:hypothetical protein